MYRSGISVEYRCKIVGFDKSLFDSVNDTTVEIEIHVEENTEVCVGLDDGDRFIVDANVAFLKEDLVDELDEFALVNWRCVKDNRGRVDRGNGVGRGCEDVDRIAFIIR